MSTTLAPSVLDMSQNNQQFGGGQSSMSMPSSTSNADGTGSHLTPYDSTSFNDFSKNHQLYGSGNSSGGSGEGTPPGIEGGWDAFINDNSWSDGHVT